MKRAWLYILHLLRANSRHGIHSPFVYRLIESCLYEEIAIDKSVVDRYQDLKQNHEKLTGYDFGKSATRTLSVSRLAHTSASKDFESRLLAKLCEHQKVNRVLELGSNIGKATSYMASACPEAQIDGVDGNAALVDFANQNFRELGLSNAEAKQASFKKFFADNNHQYDLIFIDGDHHKAPTLENYQESKKTLRHEGPIVLHDIYWSSGMMEAWETIKQDQEATVTIDLFFVGLVYFRPQQTKQHFKVRYPKRLIELFI